MFRKIVILVLTLGAGVTGAFGLSHWYLWGPYHETVVEYHYYCRGPNITPAWKQYSIPASVRLGSLTLISFPERSSTHTHYLAAPLWPFTAVFSAYPTIAFVRGPFRRWRRRKRGLCLRCGYNLEGNVSGVCSECGDAT